MIHNNDSFIILHKLALAVIMYRITSYRDTEHISHKQSDIIKFNSSSISDISKL